MKTLKTKTINLVIAWNNLRLMPPKAFQTIVEIEKVGEILEILEEPITDFAEVIKEGEELRKELAKTGNLPEEEIKEANSEWQKKQKVWQQKTNDMEEKIGDKVLEVSFENEPFNYFFQFCEKWGKEWFGSINSLLEFRKDMNETNKQPKETKKK